MRVMVDPSPARIARARPPVRAFLAFAALALLAHLAQRWSAGLLRPEEVELHYLGAGPGEGLPRAALLEELHAGAFLYGMTLFMVGALLPLCRLGPRARAGLFAAGVAAAAADLAAPFVVVAAGGGGALRVAATLLAGAALLAGVGAALATFGPAPRAAAPAEASRG